MKINYLFPIISLLLIYSNITSQVTADFGADKTKGCSPLIVSFTNNSSGSSLTFNWDFGNGNVSSLVSPQATYGEPGNYTVILTVKNSQGEDVSTKADFIEVYENPIANFTIGGQTEGCVPITLEFNDNSNPTAAAITGWIWDFGDGNLGSVQNPEHTYSIGGEFPASLQVVDANGCKSSKYIAGSIHAYEPPKVDFSANPGFICEPNLEISFSNLTTGDEPIDYQWEFGDGELSDVKNPKYTYNVNGIYNIKLSATDNNNCKSELEKEDFIQVDAVIADFTVNKDVFCIGEQVKMTNKSTRANLYQWNFGDGATSDEENPKKQYVNGGNYLITLNASRGNCKHTMAKQISVETVKADFSTSPTYVCDLNQLIRYTDKSTNADSWKWELGNKQDPIDEQNPQIYLTNTTNLRKNFKESYTDKLTVTSPNGCKDTKIVEDNLKVTLIKPAYTADPSSLGGCAPLTLNFSDNSTYDSDSDNLTQYTWQFTNYPSINQKSVSITYDQVGIYDFTYSVVSGYGCEEDVEGAVLVGLPQDPDFYITNSEYCASDAVSFNNNSFNEEYINFYSYILGDGSKPVLGEEPVHYFIDTGYMDVKLTIGYNKCYTEITKEDIVYIKPPYATFKNSMECTDPFTYTFTPHFKGADRFRWDFGDGKSDSVNDTATHTYSKTGDYTISLTTWNNTTGCVFTTTNEINVRDIKSAFKQDSIIGCPGMNVTFDGDISRDEEKFKYNKSSGIFYWAYGDGKEEFSNGPISHKFSKRGAYNVMLVVRDINGCADTSYNSVNVYQPLVDFILDTIIGCLPAQAKFSDKSTGDTTLSGWSWNFGDEKTSTKKNPQHTYTEYGFYPVELTVTDIIGCKNTLKKTDVAEILKPDPDFSVTDKTICIGDSVRFFLKTPQDDLLTFNWYSNGMLFSDQEAPTYAFNDTGYYSIELFLTDTKGCDSSKTINNFIHVQGLPVASFAADIVKSNCYPLLVHFKDNSMSDFPVTQWRWSFGIEDAGSSKQNPEHNYVIPGIYDVSLVATTEYGCSDTSITQNYIDVGGPWATYSISDTICKGDSLTFKIQNQKNIYSFGWDFGDGTLGKGEEVNHVYNSYGTIYPALLLQADQNHTCDKLMKDSIFIHELIPDFNRSDSSICISESVIFSDKSTGPDQWQWKINSDVVSTQNQFTQKFPETGLYKIMLQIGNIGGCFDSVEKEINVHPLPVVNIHNDTIICEGDKIQIWASGGEKYDWSPQEFIENGNSQKPLIYPQSNSTYTVIVTDSNNCKSTSSIDIVIHEKPTITLTNDTSIIIGETVQLNASSQKGATFEWLPVENISCSKCTSPLTSKIEESVTYTVIVRDTLACFEVSKNVSIDIMRKYSVDVPSAFTPNNDGQNDKIFVRGWGIKNLIQFNIYNRFGQQIYSSKDINEGWDGTYNGKKQDVETFIYTVTVETFEGEILSKKGNFHLIR